VDAARKPRLRLLFVSGTTTGGSAVSTNGLAAALAARGHAVGVIARHRSRPRTALVQPAHEGRSAALARIPQRLARATRRSVSSTTVPPTSEDGVDVWTCEAPERLLPAVCDAFRPDVVIAGSLARNPWTTTRATLQQLGIPSVLYVREAATIEHVPLAELRPDLVLTNSEALRTVVLAAGLAATTVPSIIDFAHCTVTSSRDTVLFVNPIESRGLSIALQLAAANRDISFAFQRSWPLDARDEHALQAMLDGHDNIEQRPYEADPARVYRDARVLLLPYRVDQRPRVVAEAQWNGIPVLASDLPAHREAVGAGGCFVALDAGPDAWSVALRAIWDDEAARRLGDAARTHAERPEQNADRVVDRFEQLVSELTLAHDTDTR